MPIPTQQDIQTYLHTHTYMHIHTHARTLNRYPRISLMRGDESNLLRCYCKLSLLSLYLAALQSICQMFGFAGFRLQFDIVVAQGVARGLTAKSE